MKPLTKKILESGIIEKNILKMFERWGTLDKESVDLVGTTSVLDEGVADFIEALDAILDENAEKKETRLEITVRPPILLFCPQIQNPKLATFAAHEDELGRFIVAPNIKLFRGAMVTPDEIGKIIPRPRWWKVLEIEPLHRGEKLVAHQVTVEKQ